MTKKQLFIIVICGLFFVFLYFGTDIRASKQDNVNRKRELSYKGLSIESFLKEAKSEILISKLTYIELQEQKIISANGDSQKVLILKDLANAWYKLKKPLVSGHYTEEIAKIVSDENTWSMAGASYLLGIQQTENSRRSIFGINQAISAFENAILINPKNIDHRVNLALCYVEKPPTDNPMKGILMLLDLNKKYPKNIATLMALGRLGIKSNQLEKAKNRFEEILRLDHNNNQAICFLSLVYEKTGNTEKYNEFSNRCQR